MNSKNKIQSKKVNTLILEIDKEIKSLEKLQLATDDFSNKNHYSAIRSGVEKTKEILLKHIVNWEIK